MATCKDCILYDILCGHALQESELKLCNSFKNKSDVVEVKHGEWIPYECDEMYGYKETVWYKCSVCGEDALGRCREDEYYSYPCRTGYCPYCGAKMDGGK